MLDALLKIKPDAVAATWYLTAATRTRALLLDRDPVRMGQLLTIEEKLLAHDHQVCD